MSQAPTPPVQTPVSFLLGGAADMFSARCKALLIAAGWHPKDFGSYSYVSKRIQAAKKRVEEYENSLKSGGKRKTKPSNYIKWLASCQSGHLTQNAVYQEEGARGDPCANFGTVPGHSTEDFPCMPQAGMAGDPLTEHGAVTVHEKNSAAKDPSGKRRPAGGKYSEKDIRTDSGKRAKMLDDDKKLAERNGRKELTPKEVAEGDSLTATSKSKGKTADSTKAKGSDAGKAKGPWNKEIDGKTAGDCINSFREAGEAAMRQKCIDERAKNRERANGGGTDAQGVKYREKLKNDAAKAEKEAQKDPNNKKKQKAAAAAKRKSTAAERAKCRADQGDKLANGYKGPFDGKQPSNAKETSGSRGKVTKKM